MCIRDSYLFLPFGLATAPGLNDASVKEVLRLLEKDSGIHLVDFVDDLLGRRASEADAWSAFERAAPFFIRVGIPVSTKPSDLRPPAQNQVWCSTP